MFLEVVYQNKKLFLKLIQPLQMFFTLNIYKVWRHMLSNIHKIAGMFYMLHVMSVGIK